MVGTHLRTIVELSAEGEGPEVDDELVAKIPPIVDMDAHVVEPADLWSSRLPSKYAQEGPHVELLPAGDPVLVDGKYHDRPVAEGKIAAWWFYEGNPYTIKRLIAAAGYPADEITIDAITFDEMRRGCWDPAARVVDNAMNGVERQMCFPNYPRFCGQLFLGGKDKDLAHLCVQAYNDWMVEEWAGPTGGRLIPLCILPLWDVELAVAEIYRNAARGVRTVAFSEMPSYLGLPSLYSRYWDPLFAACEDTSTVIAMHIGSGSLTPPIASDAPLANQQIVLFGNSICSLTEYLLSGVLHRFPRLKLLYAESQIGWLPFFLDRIDDSWVTHRGWNNSHDMCPELPSSYYSDHVVSCFFRDPVGIEMLDRIGVDNVVFETDYPHQDGTWPHTRAIAAAQFGHLDASVIEKIARGTAIRFLGLPDLEPA